MTILDAIRSLISFFFRNHKINQMKTAYTSNELYHFVGRNNPHDDEENYDVLLKILHAGCVSHPPHSNDRSPVRLTINWKRSLANEELIVPTVTCYADIPHSGLDIHINKYGKFGLSFKRELLIRCGARPVMYFPFGKDDWASISGTTLLNDIEAIYRGFNDHVVSDADSSATPSRSLGKKPNNKEEAILAMNSVFAKDFMAFIKPFNAHLIEKDPNNYYMEREWRKYGNLLFDKQDIAHIIVAFGFKKRLINKYPEYMSKIIEL